ncbi:hypothetical protein BC829DRAFT_423404 [Chytridium lagenaria]|nr:hypothetical protein BC829DRAFT_423404 [Chytridium lagenaria]
MAANAQGFWQTFSRVVDSMNIMMYWMWKLLGDVAVRECDEFLRQSGFLEEVDGAAAPLPHATSFPMDLLTTATPYHIGLDDANEIQLPPAVMPVDEHSITFPFSNENNFFSRGLLRDTFRAVYQDPRINHDHVVDNEPSPRRTIFRTWAGATRVATFGLYPIVQNRRQLKKFRRIWI